jgi:hypothetical protein
MNIWLMNIYLQRIYVIVAILVFMSCSMHQENASAESTDGITRLTSQERALLSQDELQTYYELLTQEEEHRRAQEQLNQLEELKLSNPDAYNAHVEQNQKRELIRATIQAHAAQTLGANEARYQLAELVGDDIENEIITYQQEVMELTQRIIKKQNYIDNPQELLLERVDEMLGLAQPEQDESPPIF